ncbi:MAG: heme exporter protein CcmB [Sediminibacterium sp.]|nr:heme exporter protein CcmB [Sediminibacterium sp.]MDP1811658.1 heme exporter protein CcmB [Sediminibacterium sp.]MDP3127416.1 heme exporter protein CcmB [Sediminibacterium sp.]MDP3667109.1 heme exporter protein CcmB [Sediminibacterium sp.]
MNPDAENAPMKNNRRVLALIQKDLLLEMRQQYTLYGILLYVASTIFVVYLSMDRPEDKTWNGLFWIIQLFVCINAVAKSFLAESRGRMLYFYSIAGAVDFVVSKLLFNAILMIAMSLLSLGVFTILLGNPLENGGKFIFITCLGGMSLSLVFTFLAAIAAKAQQQAALMAIMGFPIIIPQLLLLMKISTSAFSSVIQAGWWQMVFLLVGLDLMVIALAVILFPFLWKD